tara:strand:+ start:712 stop:921 length:210 start_codon:yes stop_codon:yes gene_type:complete
MTNPNPVNLSNEELISHTTLLIKEIVGIENKLKTTTDDKGLGLGNKALEELKALYKTYQDELTSRSSSK